MTRNQIEYWNLQESKRHNVATEVEINRHNVATEGIDLGNLQETQRHNYATEGIELGKLGETRRHNVATEGISQFEANTRNQQVVENVRHNQAVEGFTGTDLSIRSDTLSETTRHNQATEGIERTKAEAQAEVNRANADLIKVQKEWEALKLRTDLDLTQKQIQEMDARMEKYATEIAKLNSDITRNKFQNANQTVQTIINGLTSTSEQVRNWTSSVQKVRG